MYTAIGYGKLPAVMQTEGNQNDPIAPAPPPLPTPTPVLVHRVATRQATADRPATGLPKWKLVGAFALAAASDVLSVWIVFLPPAQIALDMLTGLAIWAILGWKWYLLPGFVAEAIPGLAVFPTWLLVVGAYAAWPMKTKA